LLADAEDNSAAATALNWSGNCGICLPCVRDTRQSLLVVLKLPSGCWILHESARRYHWEGTGECSIKSFFGGRAHYRVRGGCHAVDDRSYLLLNGGQEYEITIESRRPVESFCIFFAPAFVEDVHRNLTTSAKRLLDEPLADFQQVHFFEKNYTHDDVLSPVLFRLRAKVAHQREPGRLTDQLHDLVERLLKVHELARGESERFAAVRAGTREELYRRVCRARDYADALFADPITLSELARAACLSPNHLLRSFRQLFGETPHQFLTRRRLEEAKRMLVREGASVTEICFAVGFESHGSFSSLFRRRFGVSPSEYRQSWQKGDFEEADR
jgi:AraC family transcriptional regulator